MKKVLIALMLVATSATMVVADAEAKRLGGGGSIGRQSQSMNRPAAPAGPMQQQQAQRPAQPPAAAPAPAAPKPSPWKGILGGALLGLGLGALFSHLGLSGALASAISSILMIALIAGAAFLIFRLVRGKSAANQPQPAYGAANAGSQGGNYVPEIGSRLEPSAQPHAFQADAPAASGSSAAAMEIPADFDVQGFLRHAKTYFIRLQAAWDRADVNDLREFTTAEMFAELKLQIQERGASANVTDVVSVNADLLGLEQDRGEWVASVRFDGMIREAPGAAAESFHEIWNLTKPVSGQGGWVLAGIQQQA